MSNLDNAKLDNMNIDQLTRKANEVSNLLKTVSNAERLLILCNLLEGEQNAGILWKKSKLSQSAFSQHLAILRKNRLVKTRKEAQSVYYSLADNNIERILKVLHEIYCQETGD